MGLKLELREGELLEAVKALLEAGILREAGEGVLILDGEVYPEIITGIERFVGQKVQLGDIVYITYISILKVLIARLKPVEDRKAMVMAMVLLRFFKAPLEQTMGNGESPERGGMRASALGP